MQFQVRWKDTKKYKEYKYRNQVIKRTDGGWFIETMNDPNLYHCIECAQNAIDAKLGERKRTPGRKAHGITVVGKMPRKQVGCTEG